MDVIFIANRGSMYRYFSYLSSRIALETKVFDYSLSLSLPSVELSKRVVDEGIAFQLCRKKAKYDYPHWLMLVFKVWYRFQFKNHCYKFSRIFAVYKPRCVAIWNGHRLPERAVKYLAEQLGIQVVHFENGLLPNTTTFDVRGVNDLNSLPRKASYYRQYDPALHRQSAVIKLEVRKPHRAKRSHSKQSTFLGDLPERYIFVPFQVGFDSQVILNSRQINSMQELYCWAQEAIEYADPGKSLHIVVKEHPSDPYKYKDLYRKHPKIIFSNRNTQELIEKSEAVMTVNSSVGMEALLFHKRVIVLGEACYKIRGMVRSPSSVSELSHIVNNLDSWEVDSALVDKFIAYVRHEYLVPVTWRKPNDCHVAHIETKFRGLLSSREL
ncbi:hypothetical protein N2488_06365 [SAR92 clade bacterium H231]|nr:hypothetical protein [SAR92 clade bacterium H231]